ncbi:hypothetical protein CTEN210_04524 [Chaetoceros tenuissimus]|uniref:Uncharacterized protein n=1 Tax=Chaetoceros tenuissimus TaxID=426638 RepID=A0AAD3H2V2_9STRA|nr:hypothetical protein CTEN210_04524 [Chaetoceros tenuissimus]
MSSLHRLSFHSGKTSRQSFHGVMCVMILASTTIFNVYHLRLGSFSIWNGTNYETSQKVDSHGLRIPVTHKEEALKVKICNKIDSLLDISQWPDVVFYKDKQKPSQDEPNNEEDKEDDEQARATVAEFNRIRNSVLTTELIEHGINEGHTYYAHSFAQRFLERREDARPLSIAVTGNSFTIGSNCGENQKQPSTGSDGCAWPSRLRNRWNELVTTYFRNMTNTDIEWLMLQENAQTSNNVIHRLPTLVDDFRNKNRTLDIIILNNGISDSRSSDPWLEAVLRYLLEHFPEMLVISIIDGIPGFVRCRDCWQRYRPRHGVQGDTLQRFLTTQEYYNVTGIDFAAMSRLLSDSDEEKYKILRDRYPNSNLLWPQEEQYMMYANGTLMNYEEARPRPNGQPIFWANYTPRVEKTKPAYYPANHPPWTTHQYVADSTLYTLISILKTGIGCDEHVRIERIGIVKKPSFQETPIADKEELDRFFICQNPKDTLDARVLTSVVNATDDDNVSLHEAPVVVMCGDWKWVTDERNRSGWQSERPGSLIRFRLKSSDIPTISLTHMKSHASFGKFQVAFQPISGTNRTLQEMMTCKDIKKFDNQELLPSAKLEGIREEFSLWETVIFSGKLDSNTDEANRVMKKFIEKIEEMKDIQYIDVYIINARYYNADRTRVKIQRISSC